MRIRSPHTAPMMPLGPVPIRRSKLRRLLRWFARLTRVLTRLGWRHRNPLAPVYAAAMLLGTGLILHRIPDGARTTGAVIAMAAAGIWWWTRRLARRDRGLRAKEQVYLWSTFTAAMAWLFTASLADIKPPMPGILLLLMIAAGIPWWWHRRIRPTHAMMTASGPAAVWEDKVSSMRGCLPGSWLTEITIVDDGRVRGWSALINLPGGQLTTENAVTSTARIASAYGVSPTAVVIEPMLSGEANLARLLILERNPLIDVQEFTGPTLDPATGWITIGLHADGGDAKWRLFVPKSGSCHGMIAGTTGSGKSGLINTLCVEISHSGLAALWLADPEDGESVPDWQDHVDWFAGNIDEIRAMLQAAERVMEGRKTRRSKIRWTDADGILRRGKGFFEPTREEPQLVVVVEEGPDVLADQECKRIVARIGKKGRKVGVCVILVTQIPSVVELGGDVTIRSMLSSTNVLMFRTSDKMSKQMGMPADLPVDPANLPVAWPDGSPTAGLGYLAAAGGRLSPLRGKFVREPHKWAASRVVVTLEAEAEQDAGVDYISWRERREDDVPPPSLDGAVMVTIPTRPTTAATATGATEPAPAQVVKQTTAREAILEYLSGRESATTGVIAQALGIALPTTTTTLRRMETAGQTQQVRHGVWALQDSAVSELPGQPLETVMGAR